MSSPPVALTISAMSIEWFSLDGVYKHSIIGPPLSAGSVYVFTGLRVIYSLSINNCTTGVKSLERPIMGLQLVQYLTQLKCSLTSLS